MIIKEYKRSTYFYADDGREIAHLTEQKLTDGKTYPVLAFNSDRMDVPCYKPKAKNMSFSERANTKYRPDFEKLTQMYPDAKQTEYCNA